jgi:hypothetical protein
MLTDGERSSRRLPLEEGGVPLGPRRPRFLSPRIVAISPQKTYLPAHGPAPGNGRTRLRALGDGRLQGAEADAMLEGGSPSGAGPLVYDGTDEGTGVSVGS